jgi:hypothetical protein
MIPISQLKIMSRELIDMITRSNKIEKSDIRLIKYETGTFPRKIIQFTDPNDGLQKFKESPYLNGDLFILFDVIVDANLVSEVVDNKFKSHMPFTLIVNLYGDEASDELNFMMAKLSTFKIRNFLYQNGVSLKEEPTDFQVLDGKENGNWWIRRRIEIKMNMEQVIDLSLNDLYQEFDTVEENIERLGDD